MYVIHLPVHDVPHAGVLSMGPSRGCEHPAGTGRREDPRQIWRLMSRARDLQCMFWALVLPRTCVSVPICCTACWSKHFSRMISIEGLNTCSTTSDSESTLRMPWLVSFSLGSEIYESSSPERSRARNGSCHRCKTATNERRTLSLVDPPVVPA